jgi:RES domain-containing protein
VKFSGFVYRAHNPRWAFAPDSGVGAASTGGRYNPVGMRALYTSSRFETAWLEAQQAFPFKAQPMTLCAYEVACEDILDLTDAGILTAHGASAEDLACAWRGSPHDLFKIVR